jgi:hypothetical protein
MWATFLPLAGYTHVAQLCWGEPYLEFRKARLIRPSLHCRGDYRYGSQSAIDLSSFYARQDDNSESELGALWEILWDILWSGFVEGDERMGLGQECVSQGGRLDCFHVTSPGQKFFADVIQAAHCAL